jgi:MtN3 and saliva related transmembrane protein
MLTLTEAVGWASTPLLLATIGRPVYSEWRSKATAGLSHGYSSDKSRASSGFTIYCILLHNWVFLFSNVAMLVMGITGEVIYISNRRPRRS